MAAAATEAFINELGACYLMTGVRLGATETACGVVLAEAERSRASTELKYLVASLRLSGAMFDRGGQPFQDFSTLTGIRNDLMHPRPLDRFDDDGVMVPPAYVREFERRGIAYERGVGVSVSWLNLLETEQVASWACRVAVEIFVSRRCDDTSRRCHRDVRSILHRALSAARSSSSVAWSARSPPHRTSGQTHRWRG